MMMLAWTSFTTTTCRPLFVVVVVASTAIQATTACEVATAKGGTAEAIIHHRDTTTVVAIGLVSRDIIDASITVAATANERKTTSNKLFSCRYHVVDSL